MLEQVGEAGLRDHSEGQVGKSTKVPTWFKVGKDAAFNTAEF